MAEDHGGRIRNFAPNLAAVPTFQDPTAPGLGGPGGYPDGTSPGGDGPTIIGLEGLGGLGEAKGV